MENQTMTLAEKALLMHEKWNGKLETIAKSKVNSREDLAIAYTPGVYAMARSSREFTLDFAMVSSFPFHFSCIRSAFSASVIV